MMRLLRFFRSFTAEPLPPIRPTEDILIDIDRQLRQLSRTRAKAVKLIEKMEGSCGGD